MLDTTRPALERLAREFAQPPRAFSPTPIWWWSGDRLDRSRLRWQMEQLVAGGVYNAIILNLAPTGPLYGADPDRPTFMSEAWWELFQVVCADAKPLGMRLWFYDQFGFSGANLQGELVRQDPELAGQWLEAVTAEGDGQLEVTCPAGGQPLSATYTLLDEQGAPVSEPLPALRLGPVARAGATGRKRLRLVYAIRRGFDYFSPEACRRLLDTVHGAFERQAGRYFGRVIVGSFQDELPSLPSWGRGFAEAFQRRRGYDLREHLGYLFEGEGAAAEQVRVDYHQVRAELGEAAFFRPLFDWHEHHGLICGFDQQGPSREGQPLGSVRQYADYLATHRWYGAPGSDHHGHAKIHSSLAHLYQRPRVWIESFHSSGWGGTLEETFDWLLPWLRAGATLYNPHAVYYSTRGGWWEWAPPSTCWRQPYWKHYPVFAQAVSRLCCVLSQGTHVCDLALLFPTTTIQAGLTLEAPLDRAALANAVYEALVGGMMFLKFRPGLLDQDRRDFDIVDDASVQRAAVRDGTLRVSGEAYGVVILPACAVLPATTAAQLVRFVKAGGMLIAVGALPDRLSGGDEIGLTELRSLFDTGRAIYLAEPEALAQALAGRTRRIEAPVPVLHRRVDGTDVVFVPAAFPHATQNTAPSDAEWHKVEYQFDPGQYQRPMTITAHGFTGTPELWDVLSGERRPLVTRARGDALEVDLPFDTAPAALVVWSGTGRSEPGEPQPPEEVLHEFTEPWDCTLEHTLDNRHGDVDKPDSPGAPPVQTWRFWHRVEGPDDDGISAGWPAAAPGYTHEAYATYGQYGWWTGPCPEGDLPRPLGSDAPPVDTWAGDWRPAVYSLQRGLHHDPLHEHTLGPKGHVPEEFLRFGRVERGLGVQFRTAVWVPAARRLHLALGAAARKQAWLNGQLVGEQAAGYLWLPAVELKAGMNVLEWRLTAEAESQRGWRLAAQDEEGLRAYWALVARPDAFIRPERMTAGTFQKDARLKYRLDFEVPFNPSAAVLQVAADAPARLLVNEGEVGRQGGFDPYGDMARVQPYTVTNLRPGPNTVVVEVQDTGRPHTVLVDGRVHGARAQMMPLLSGPDWRLQRDDALPEAVTLEAHPWLDPAWCHPWRRPHPLPGAAWIEDTPADETVLSLVPDAHFGQSQAEWFWWHLPPGALALRLPVAGDARLWVDGTELAPADGHFAIPASTATRRWAAARVVPERGRTGGGVFTGPVTYQTGEGRIELGDWRTQGLEAFAGGVRYRASFTAPADGPGPVVLDLGRVRGTVEVWVNDQPVGTRVWSPYRLDVSAALKPGPSRVEIVVFNTLAPYFQAVSPTHYVRPNQTVSGLFGPVRLLSRSSASRTGGER